MPIDHPQPRTTLLKMPDSWGVPPSQPSDAPLYQLPSRPFRRPGFTLIELLVVIAIIAILMALLLPAIQQTREAARRTQCKNNLVQLSLAIQNYEASFEMLPPGTVNQEGPIQNIPAGYHMSWIVQILPLMEQTHVFRAIDFSESAYSESNARVRQTQIKVLKCPSDYKPVYQIEEVGTVIASSYAGCFSGEDTAIASENNGLLFLNSSVTREQIRDGSANTILLGEKSFPRQTADLGWMSGTAATLRNTGVGINLGWDVVNFFSQTSSEPPVAPGPDATGGFSSLHSGGANFALADGSVRFVSESIDMTIFSYLGNRHDMQLLNDF